MKKTYLIILVMAIVGAAGLYMYQNNKQGKELNAHHSQQYKRIIEASQKSSIAGLAHMGRALNKYKEEKGAYPAKLAALYPEYIPVKAFIDDLQWSYKPKGEDFFLSKTIRTKKDKVVTASIGRDLMPQDESEIAVASVAAPQKITAGTKSNSIKISPKTGSSQNLTTKTKTLANTLTANSPSAGLKNYRNNSGDIASPGISKERKLPDSEEVITHKLTEKEKFVHGIMNRQDMLVWKNEDGSLGFSNIQYPRSKDLTVYDKGEWVQIRGKKWYAHTQKDSR